MFYCERALISDLRSDLVVKLAQSDRPLFRKSSAQNMDGLCARYADDTFQFDNKHFLEGVTRKKRNFHCSESQYSRVQFAAIQNDSERNRFVIHHRSYG